jgi:hypothetical protein
MTSKHKGEIRPVTKDVQADDPVGTMNRFTDGLRRVLSAPKPVRGRDRKRKKRHR